MRRTVGTRTQEKTNLPVVVVGHTNCGGVKAAYAAGAPTATDSSSHAHATEPESSDTCSRRRSYFARSASENSTEEAEEANDPLNNFLAPLIDLRRALPPNATVLDLTVANVRAGVIHVVNSTTIQDAWAAGREVCVHGWVSGIHRNRECVLTSIALRPRLWPDPGPGLHHVLRLDGQLDPVDITQHMYRDRGSP